MGELSWNILIVSEGYETIKIERYGRVIEQGSYSAGHTRHLTIGDVVKKRVKGKWVGKFGLRIWKGRPAFWFRPKKIHEWFVPLDSLSPQDPIDPSKCVKIKTFRDGVVGNPPRSERGDGGSNPPPGAKES